MNTPNRIRTGLFALAAGIIATTFGTPSVSEAQTLNASGASFPAPLYQRWFIEYNKANPDIKINYQSIGSGSGVKQFMQGLTDFGASDAAMKPKDIEKVEGGVTLLPMTAGAIVVSYNLPGVTESIKLPKDVYPKIFLGEIKKWDDPAIAKANPGVKIPGLPITVAYRADGSGTTFNFTNHLAAISPEFKEKVGAGKKVDWPAGVGGKGNEGVAALIKQTPGTIGYIEYGYAQHLKIPTASLQNRDGKFVAPTPESAAATLANIKLPENLIAFDFNPEGEASYPIVTFTWWLCHPKNKDGKGAIIKKLADWCLTEGQKMSTELGYIPLPPDVVAKVKAAADKLQ